MISKRHGVGNLFERHVTVAMFYQDARPIRFDAACDLSSRGGEEHAPPLIAFGVQSVFFQGAKPIGAKLYIDCFDPRPCEGATCKY